MTLGVPPAVGSNSQLVDGSWFYGLSGGTNMVVDTGITAYASGGATSATQLPALNAFYSIDTVGAGNASIALPHALAGTWIVVFNNTGTNSMNVYPFQNGTDTIKNVTTAYALIHNKAALFFSATDGQWAVIKSA